MKNLGNYLDFCKAVGLPIDFGSIVRAAVEGQGFQHQTVAADIGYNADYWNKVLGGARGITLDRLGRLPVEVQREIVSRWANALGMAPAPGLEELAGLADLIASRRVRITIESK